MHFSIPLVGLLASLGLYGIVLGVIALRDPGRLGKNANLQEPVEWVAAICISLFGLVGTAAALATSFGASWVAYLVSVGVVGALVVGFFRMLEVSPAPFFALLVNTRFFSRRKNKYRRGFFAELKKTWAESSIDGDIVAHQAEELDRRRSRNAWSGAIFVATLITIANVVWVGQLLVSVDASLVFLVPMVVLFVGLVVVLGRAGSSVASRAGGIDWRRPY